MSAPIAIAETACVHGGAVTEEELGALLGGATAERGTKEQLAISALFRSALAQVSQCEGIPEQQIVGLSLPERVPLPLPLALPGRPRAATADRADAAAATFAVAGLLLVGAAAVAALLRGDVVLAVCAVIAGQTVGGSLLWLRRR